MSIRHLRDSDLDAATIKIMTVAYEDALRILRLANRNDPITELIAKKIVQIAKTGERNPAWIRERALIELGIG